MLIPTDIENELESERTIKRLHYSFNAWREDIRSINLGIEPMQNALGEKLHHCEIRIALRDGRIIELEETQSSSALAVSRALERCARTVQRHFYTAERRLIV